MVSGETGGRGTSVLTQVGNDVFGGSSGSGEEGRSGEIFRKRSLIGTQTPCMKRESEYIWFLAWDPGEASV